MMYLIPDPVANKQLYGIAESSPSRPSPSKSSQHGENSSPYLLACTKSPRSHRRRHYSSDEEDDSRDRQSHWKRIKTHSDDNPRGSTRNLIRYTERDRHSCEKPPSRMRQQGLPPSSNPRPGHRVIVLKGSANEKGAGLHRFNHESEVRTGSGSKGWDGAVGMRVRDGGTAFKDIDLGGSKRKQDLMSAFGNASRSSLTMSERSMVVREKLTARRGPVEKGYEFRVSDREVGEFVYGEDDDDDSLFLDDSRQFDDDYPTRSMSGSDLRELLNRRGRAEETMSRETRGYGDYTTERFCSDVGVRVRRVEFDLSAGNGKVQGSTVRKVLDLGRSSRSGNDDSKERTSLGTGGSAASVGMKSERDMELERREKRERWAEKERDLEKELEKENMLRTAQQAKLKSVTVVDYSHKFTLAKAPISKRPFISLFAIVESLICSGV